MFCRHSVILAAAAADDDVNVDDCGFEQMNSTMYVSDSSSAGDDDVFLSPSSEQDTSVVDCEQMSDVHKSDDDNITTTSVCTHKSDDDTSVSTHFITYL